MCIDRRTNTTIGAGMIDFSLRRAQNVHWQALEIDKKALSLGDSLGFSFNISSENNASQLVVIDFAIHYMKSNGTLAPKVFKLKNIEVGPKSVKVKKKHAFKDFSTRKHYSGKHFLEILVSGRSYGKVEFDLTVAKPKIVCFGIFINQTSLVSYC